ncbi:hypothetical protein AMJ57_01365 [Parcubacteria bacterium SG8_24]|nr:MAG: hypothetical protein AMJ57_01365 [Parcubacteria bacterium SG8_24]
MVIKTIIFDLDDTLIDNTYRYHEALWKCGLIICQALGGRSVDPKRVIEKKSEIDNGLVGEYGYSVKRFPIAIVKTYEYFCEEKGLRPRTEVKRRLFNVASRFKYGPFELRPGVLKMLRSFKREGYRLHLVTVGDLGLQSRKVIQAGLARKMPNGAWKSPIFDGVHIPARDKRPVFEEIAAGNPRSCMMVGDSTGSDIKPASDLGMVAVLIPSETSFNTAQISHSRYHKLESVLELPEFISRFRLRRSKNGQGKKRSARRKKNGRGRAAKRGRGRNAAKRLASSKKKTRR